MRYPRGTSCPTVLALVILGGLVGEGNAQVDAPPPPARVAPARVIAPRQAAAIVIQAGAGGGMPVESLAPRVPVVVPPRPSANAETGPLLNLIDDGYMSGTIKNGDKPGMLRWQGTAFTEPFDFDISVINTIHFPVPSTPSRATGDFAFDLSGGDVVFGTLKSLDNTSALIEIPKMGRLQVEREHLLRIARWRDSAELVYLGPNGLSGWSETKAWREESGELVTNQDGAILKANLALPAKAIVEFEISWKENHSFVLALGVDPASEASVAQAFRFEIWDDELVALREVGTEADLTSIAKVTDGAGRAHFKAYLDQESGRMLVVSERGKTVGELKINTKKPLPTAGGVWLENKKGELRLERLKISRWSGQDPQKVNDESVVLSRSDGTGVAGRVERYDAETKSFVVRSGDTETRIPEDKTELATISSQADEPLRSIRVVLQDGTRLTGALDKVENGEMFLRMPGVKDAIHVPVLDLRALVVLRHDLVDNDVTKLNGRLDTVNTHLTGRLADAVERPGASCIAWKPFGSETISALRVGLTGQIVYKTTPPKLRSDNPFRAAGAAPQPAGGLQGFLKGFSRSGSAEVHTPRSLFLRTGDVIPSEVTKIDEEGVTFRSKISDSTFVSHDKIKAIELADMSAPTVRLSKSKRDRLLMLPRVQKGSPPTHMIRSTNGDYLRGRVVEMDDKNLKIETRLENKDVPRSRIARIIWLHPDEAPAAKSPASPTGATRVQAVRSDGVRLTFVADRVADSTLSGKSEVLGPCRVRLDEVDQILIGGAIEQEAARLAYQQWKLQNAPEPKVYQEDGAGSEGGRSAGMESTMVGKPAPEFTLDLLDGSKFRLGAEKGQIVVLDFWATWCGPCLQAMPQVEKVTAEFKDQGVKLVAVNLQEGPKEINAMLERHKLVMTVALDRNGIVAEKYAANAIPQTVIVDRQGNVARLFIGGGSHLGDQLRDALKAVLAGSETKKDESAKP